KQTSAQIPGEGLTISPPLKELTMAPGQSSTHKIKVTNPTNKVMEVYPVVYNFRAKDETGEPFFYPAEEEEAAFSLAHWISFRETKLALTPEQVVDFNYEIKVPENAEPGGHYGVVFFATQPPEISGDLNQVAIASMIGSLQLVKVPGEIIEQGNLKEFSTSKFFLKPPVDFVVRITNLGNVHFKPFGEAVIKNWRGKEVGEVVVNESKGNVLPESTRKFEQRWEPEIKAFYKIPIGRFKADLSLVYGDSKKALSGEVIFWIIPLWLIIVAAAVLLLVIVLTILLIKKKKKREEKYGLTKLKDNGKRVIIR
ncbi:unnamed protein product, partial [marine sediment metagenome]